MTGTRGSGRVPGLGARCPSGPLQGHRLSCRCHGAALAARRVGPSVTSTGCGPSRAATAEHRGTIVPERDRNGDTGVLTACPLGGVAAGRDAGPWGGQVCPGAPTGGAAAGCPPGSVPPQGSQTPSPRTKRGHEVRPRSTVAAPGPFPPACTGGALRLAVPLKIPPPSALLNSLAAGKRQQGRNEAPNVITVLVSLPPASSQPHLSRRQRAGREERNQCLSLA